MELMKARNYLGEEVHEPGEISLITHLLVLAIEGAKKGDLLDMFWLLDDEAKYWLEALGFDRDIIVEFVANEIIKQSNKKDVYRQIEEEQNAEREAQRI